MLVIVDMQNQILDEENEAYVPDGAALVKRIAKRLEQARADGGTSYTPATFQSKSKEHLMKKPMPCS